MAAWRKVVWMAIARDPRLETGGIVSQGYVIETARGVLIEPQMNANVHQ